MCTYIECKLFNFTNDFHINIKLISCLKVNNKKESFRNIIFEYYYWSLIFNLHQHIPIVPCGTVDWITCICIFNENVGTVDKESFEYTERKLSTHGP